MRAINILKSKILIIISAYKLFFLCNKVIHLYNYCFIIYCIKGPTFCIILGKSSINMLHRSILKLKAYLYNYCGNMHFISDSASYKRSPCMLHIYTFSTKNLLSVFSSGKLYVLLVAAK